ncbi:hypothetical protein MKZ38_009151 [Zalerion maritima]|uniref:Multicopper oxidase n=1 Tax=Zalerion maritima TaxID=339359 RepID=A0AAD5WUV2_9PEZI|nr:hypothetical protein MKZ38_009151 [Zalerion maritima]
MEYCFDSFGMVPDTDITREYWFELVDGTASPVGYERYAQSINDSIPGPTIFANWGDTVTVQVTILLSSSTNGTSIHFHGIRQDYTNPNESVVGGIAINGPATANYNDDLSAVFLNDWIHETADELWTTAGVYGDGDDDDQTGSHLELAFEKGASYRMRLVNAAVDTPFEFSIDNHTLAPIATDLVPIEPYITTLVRAVPQVARSDNDSGDSIRAIAHYGSSTDTPPTTGYEYQDSCSDEDASDLYRNYPKFADSATPTLLQVYENVTSFKTDDNVIELDGDADDWAYLVIETTFTVSHLIHPHGFYSYVLAQDEGIYSSSSVTLNLDNPPRRDTSMLPSAGYLVIAVPLDNPGVWIMHFTLASTPPRVSTSSFSSAKITY